MNAGAEAAIQNQFHLLEEVLTYVTRMKDAWSAELLLHHVKFDETPIRVLGQYSEGASGREYLDENVYGGEQLACGVEVQALELWWRQRILDIAWGLLCYGPFC